MITNHHHLNLSVLPTRLAVCRLPADTQVPAWAYSRSFFCVTRTSDELSVLCHEADVPDTAQAQRGWRAMKVEGPLDFALTGVLARILAPLAAAGISIFAVSTYDTDYVLVQESRLADAVAALREAGYQI